MPAKTLTRKLGGSWGSNSGTAPCPCCQPERRKDQHALSITWKAGKLLLYCKKSQCKYQDILSCSGFDAPKAERLSTPALTEERVTQGRRRAKAALLAEEIMSRTVRKTHSYLTLKGFPTLELSTIEMRQLRGIMPIPKVIQDVQNSESLLCIPLSTPIGALTSIQLLSPFGVKCFIPGGRTGGSGWFPCESGYRPMILCEGVATSLSVLRASKRISSPVSVAACMSAGGIVAMALKGIGDAVIADHDKSGAGQRAARETGLLWSMPEQIGDINDAEMRSHAEADACLRKVAFGIPWTVLKPASPPTRAKSELASRVAQQTASPC